MVAAFAAFAILAGSPATAAELKVMSSGAYRDALDEIVTAFTKTSTTKVVVQYDPAAVVGRKIDAGEAFDVAITSASALAGLVKKGIVLADSTAVVGVNAVTLAYLRGTPKPDISTPEAMKATLLAAKAISFSDPALGGSSSNYFAALIEKLGIADEVKRKGVLTRPGAGAFPVGEGKADIGVAQTSEVAMVPSVEGVAILPNDPKSKSTYAAGVSATSKETEAAKALVKFMQSPEALAVRKAKGLAAD
jgi:molybdate transport system substrate-binding protein